MTTTISLSGHTALVTGASRNGIGRAIARRLSAHGANVVLHASGGSVEGLHETRELILAAGGKAECVQADLGDGEARATLVQQASAFFGPVDILVNNAAKITAYAPPSKIDLPARHAMFEINFHGPVDLIQQALPAMRERGWGRIVNITSDSVNTPNLPFNAATKFTHALALYGASKIALDRYTLGLAAELHGTGVTVNGTKPYAISWSDSADKIARQVLQVSPELVEPLEMLAEAAFLLVSRDATGLILNSREILQLYQAPMFSIDGELVLGDAVSRVSMPSTEVSKAGS
jgi:NAD(P)-dependent dehydrogenase (short-subunit alcohol dehydrogenase family)